jgi:hypothetical protein
VKPVDCATAGSTPGRNRTVPQRHGAASYNDGVSTPLVPRAPVGDPVQVAPPAALGERTAPRAERRAPFDRACRVCGYGVAVDPPPPACPMCGTAGSWLPAAAPPGRAA